MWKLDGLVWSLALRGALFGMAVCAILFVLLCLGYSEGGPEFRAPLTGYGWQITR